MILRQKEYAVLENEGDTYPLYFKGRFDELVYFLLDLNGCADYSEVLDPAEAVNAMLQLTQKVEVEV